MCGGNDSAGGADGGFNDGRAAAPTSGLSSLMDFSSIGMAVNALNALGEMTVANGGPNEARGANVGNGYGGNEAVSGHVNAGPEVLPPPPPPPPEDPTVAGSRAITPEEGDAEARAREMEAQRRREADLAENKRREAMEAKTPPATMRAAVDQALAPPAAPPVAGPPNPPERLLRSPNGGRLVADDYDPTGRPFEYVRRDPNGGTYLHHAADDPFSATPLGQSETLGAPPPPAAPAPAAPSAPPAATPAPKPVSPSVAGTVADLAAPKKVPTPARPALFSPSPGGSRNVRIVN